MSRVRGYGKVWNLGHAAVAALFDGPVEVQEKVDGSQFSFGVIDGELVCRSKRQQIELSAPGMFDLAVATAMRLAPDLEPGWTYRGEYLRKPKHNVLAYDRVPKQNMILFDVDKGMEDYRGNAERFLEAERLSLECVPLLKEGTFDDWQTLKTLLDKQSILGGQTIEGFVIKGYGRYCDDGKLLMGKYVSEKFKEVHTKEWKKANPGGKDILGELADAYRSKSRWQKAVQHLRERGELTGSPQDIGALMKEVNEDVLVECGEEIRHRLFKWAWKHISRKVAAGLPEWYKEELAKQQFEEE